MRGLTRLSVHPIEAAAHVAELSGVDVVHLERDDPDLLAHAPVVYGTRYPAPVGDPHIRARLAAHYSARSHRAISAAQVVLVPGVNLVLHFALLALTGTGDEVLVPNPGSPSYAELARLAGATPVGYPLHAEAGFLPDADEITSLITSRTRVLVLNSPHNPTGALLPESVLTRLFEVANDRRLYVVVDEAHRELTSGVSALTAATAHDRTIVMNTVSGRHAGAAVVPRHLADDMAVLMTNTNSHLSLQLQQSMLYALTAPEADAWRAETREAYAARHGLVVDELGALPDVILHVRRGAWYAFPHIRGAGLGDKEFSSRLLGQTGVAVVPGSVFGSRGAGHVRLALAQPAVRLADGLARIGVFLDGLR